MKYIESYFGILLEKNKKTFNNFQSKGGVIDLFWRATVSLGFSKRST